jgi:hypothetical protein
VSKCGKNKENKQERKKESKAKPEKGVSKVENYVKT